MSDTSIKNMFYVLIAILTIYPIIELLFKKRDWLIKILGLIFILFFWFISCKYKKITDRETKETKQTSDSLNNEIMKKDSLFTLKADSTNMFLKRLNKIGIKDSSNYPIINKSFNTDIEKARDVYIGGQ